MFVRFCSWYVFQRDSIHLDHPFSCYTVSLKTDFCYLLFSISVCQPSRHLLHISKTVADFQIEKEQISGAMNYFDRNYHCTNVGIFQITFQLNWNWLSCRCHWGLDHEKTRDRWDVGNGAHEEKLKAENIENKFCFSCRKIRWKRLDASPFYMKFSGRLFQGILVDVTSHRLNLEIQEQRAAAAAASIHPDKVPASRNSCCMHCGDVCL